MAEQTQEKPYVLGLDLGVQSLGWAVIDLDGDGKPCRVRKTGVRCFDSGVGSEREIEMGKDESANAKRREARQHRRQLWRRAQRLRRVLHVLRGAGLLPAGPTEGGQRHEYFLKLDAELAASYASPSDRVSAHLVPYRLRAAGLDGPLSAHALGRALYHLAQRRGFLSNRKARKDSEDEGVVKAGIGELRGLMEQSGARTLGEYFARLDPEERRIRGRFTARSMYQEEFEKIWSAQAAHHPALTEELKAELYRAIFFQRPLKSQSGLIGKCDLEPGQRRAAAASLDAQRFRYWQKINDLEMIAPDGEIRCLTAEERKLLAEAFEAEGDLTFGRLRTLLRLKKPKGSEHGYTFNLEEGGEKKLAGNRTGEKLARVLGGRWEGMAAEKQNGLVQEMLSFAHEDALARRLEKAWGFDASTAAQLAALDFEPGYSAISRRAIGKLLPRLQAGERLNTARTAVYGDRLLEGKVFDRLPPVRKAVPSLRNPVVCRVLTEARKVVNALVRAYGKPQIVRIELARDLKKGRRQRQNASKEMRENEKRRDHAREKIAMLTELGIQEPRPGDILKMLLAEECNWECPYTGKTITPRTLLGSTPEFDVEHILPFSRSLDNSFLNKTLCYHEENRSRKQNRTPWEAYQGDADRWHTILQRLRRFRGSGAEAKLRRFQMEELPADFTARHLNDTRYASRLAADYVGVLFGKRVDDEGRLRVQVSAGRTTAFLRGEWRLNAILNDGGEKTRGDHRHHAVDAVVIALTAPSAVQQLSRAAERAQQIGRRLFAEVEPLPAGFLDEVRRSIEAISVSFRVDRRLGGTLHKETLYSRPQQGVDKDGKPAKYRHVRKPLSRMSANDVEAIVDGRIRKCVQAKLQELGGDPQKAFAEPANHPNLQTHDGRVVPIHKARVRLKVQTMAIGKFPRERHAAGGNNHHMEIVATLDSAGKTKCWTGHVVSLFDATQRKKDGKPVVCHDHGAGKEFMFSLACGEYVMMEYERGQSGIFRVATISEGEIEFRLHTDARPIKVQGRKRVRKSPGELLKVHARKVAVDPLGKILPAHD